MGNWEQQSRVSGRGFQLRTSPSKEGKRLHFLNKNFYGQVFFILFSYYIFRFLLAVLYLSPWAQPYLPLTRCLVGYARWEVVL